MFILSHFSRKVGTLGVTFAVCPDLHCEMIASVTTYRPWSTKASQETQQTTLERGHDGKRANKRRPEWLPAIRDHTHPLLRTSHSQGTSQLAESTEQATVTSKRRHTRGSRQKGRGKRRAASSGRQKAQCKRQGPNSKQPTNLCGCRQ